jgi:formate hydrogenlyase subunit 6/NADH:ubiquinone oxidoreductase subunit I
MANKPRVSQMFRKAVTNIFVQPATTKYPFVKAKLADGFRGQPIFNCKLCIGCGLCRKDCPTQAIEMVMGDGKKYPQVNLSKCIFCYTCAEGCPKKAITCSDVFELATTDKSSLVLNPYCIR